MTTRLAARSVFVASPREGTAIMGGSFYTRATGLDLESVHVSSSASDMIDVEHYRQSADNGRSWRETGTVVAKRRADRGTFRRHARFGLVDPLTGRYLRFRNEAILPTDAVLEYMTHNTIHYEVSEDGGRSFLCDEPVVQGEPGFDEDHPLPGVWRGRNSYMIGDFAGSGLTMANGTILLPCQISPVGPDGKYANRGGGYTYTDAAVLRGTWRADRRLDWRLAARLEGDPARSTRGLIEPTLADLGDGRLLMVMRGSNDRRPELPGRRWHSISPDGGSTFPPAEPWRFTDGEPFGEPFGKPFYSPSSCSQLLSHSSGRIYWLGNLCPANPAGNLPRHPFVIAEVDRATGMVLRDSVQSVDDRGPEDPEFLTLSNFCAREDRETRRVVVHLGRFGRPSEAERQAGKRFQGDCMRYEIELA